MNGFQNIWQRWIKKTLNETELQEKFSEKSLRTKVGSASESDLIASQRLNHTDPTITKRHYREKPNVVSPLIRSANRE
jgi:hypothetical protein